MSYLASLDMRPNGLRIDGTIVSATAAEINLVDGALAGVAVPNKALIAGADNEVDGLRESVEVVTANRTLTADDSGKTFIVTTANVVITLPATAIGVRYRFVLGNAALSAGVGLSISPAAADKIMGNGFTSADNKDAILGGAGDREGDTLEIVGDGADGWYITTVIGTWTREA